MSRRFTFLTSIVLLAAPVGALASYQMFCEIEGEVVSEPVVSDLIEFEFEVSSSRDIEVEGLGSGWPDCHRLNDKRVKVVLELEDAGDREQILQGARLTLERYEIDVILRETGEYLRSIKHVRTD